MTESNRQPAGGGRQRWILGFLGTFADLALGIVLVKAYLGAQLSPSYVHSCPEEAATDGRLLCISKQVTQGQSQAVSDTGP